MSDALTPDRDSELDQLLPWYVNGTLGDDERSRVEAYLSASAAAREEVELLRRLRDHVKASQPSRSPGELGLKRLQREIAAERQAAPARPRGGGSPGWWRPAAIAAALVIAIQGALLFEMLPERGVGPATGGGSGGSVIEVNFAADATESEIRAALQAVDGRLIDGPGALGVYRVRLVGVAPDDAAAIRDAIATLEALPDVVTGANAGQ